MAEFEELRLTVNLVDNASAGLTKIRSEIGLLTQSATGLTVAVNAASAGVTNLGNATNKSTPGVQAFNAVVREAAQNAALLKDGFERLGVASQGLQSLPQIAGGMRDMGVAVHGLAGAFDKAGLASKGMVIGVGAVAIAVVGLGAAVVAYGVSVFKFAKEMDQLGKTARQMGVAFSELKYAQDEAKKFGASAESITRSFQAVGDAQFNLSKNNSSLRSRLIGMGVEANWVNQLAAMDPNKARNAVITYGKQLERQLLDAGVAKNVARAMMNQFGAEFGLSAEDMEIGILKDPDPKTKAELERIGELSKQIGIVWGEIGAIWDDFSTEILAMGLPIVLDALKTLQAQLPALLSELKTGLKGLIEALPGFIATIPETLTSIRTTMTDVANVFRDVKGLYDTITGQTSELTNTKAVGQKVSERTSGEGEKGEGAVQQAEREKQERDLANSDLARGAGIDDIGTPPSTPSKPPEFNANRAGRLTRPALPPQHRYYNGGMQPQLQSYQGGNDNNGGNNPLLMRASFTSEELVDQTDRNTTQAEKLTLQLEKLNAFFDRLEGKSNGSAGGGFQNAAYHPDGGGGGSGGSGSGGSGGSGSGFGSPQYPNLGTSYGNGSSGNAPNASGGGGNSSSSSPASDAGRPASGKTGERISAAKAAMEDQLRKEGVPEGNIKEAANLLAGQGLSESELNPTLSHDQGTGHGIYGARLDRRSRMHKWLADNGYDKNSLEGQSRYMAHEAMTDKSYKQSRNALMNADPANRAANVETLTRNFENPLDKGPGQMARRLGRTKQAAGVEAGSAAQAQPSSGPSASNVKVDDSIEGRKTALAALREDMEAGGITTTSGYRDPGHKLSQANKGSAHTKALAFDSRARTPEQADAAMAAIRKRMAARGLEEGKDYNMLDEVRHPSGHATGPHIHTALTPQGMRKYQEARAGEAGKVDTAAVQPNRPGDPSPVLDIKGSKNTLLDLPLGPNRSGTSGANRNDLDRQALDRAALSDAMTVKANGKVTVDVADSRGPRAGTAPGKLFAETPMQKQEAGQLTQHGPSVAKATEETLSI